MIDETEEYVKAVIDVIKEVIPHEEVDYGGIDGQVFVEYGYHFGAANRVHGGQVVLDYMHSDEEVIAYFHQHYAHVLPSESTLWYLAISPFGGEKKVVINDEFSRSELEYEMNRRTQRNNEQIALLEKENKKIAAKLSANLSQWELLL